MGYYEDVRAFHVKFNVPTDLQGDPRLLDPEDQEYREKFLGEELSELGEAYRAGDLAGVIDALQDLIYVAAGTGLMMGVPPKLWQELWNDVQRANMAKERATSAADPRSKRAHSLDVVKPAGWRAPDGAGILERYAALLAHSRAPAPPVDRSQRVLTDGSPVPDDGSHTELKANGQQQGYVVLTPEERARGWVRPYRDAYKHVGPHVCGYPGLPDPEGKKLPLVCTLPPGHAGPHRCDHQVEDVGQLERAGNKHHIGGCQAITPMTRSIAETYARDPGFYSGTFCTTCGKHRPLSEFRWYEMDGSIGPIVGS